jgi:hypothetical protein
MAICLKSDDDTKDARRNDHFVRPLHRRSGRLLQLSHSPILGEKR